jgi:aryl-alcohol dehydrogenase-like predicted oxidoreductase
MEHRKLGSLEVSLVGVGCNNFGMRIGADQARSVVDAAIDAGVNFFDTADVYGGTKSEEMLGAALQGRRDRVVVATKFRAQIGDDASHSGASARWINQAVEDSLRRLGTDYIDLYQQHGPDDDVAIEETLGALDALVRSGKVREIGCSNFSVPQLDAAEAVSSANGLARFASVQNQLSLLHRDPLTDVLPWCEQKGVGFLPYFPLASGLLTGKYRRDQPPAEGTRLSMLPAERAARVLSEDNFTAVERLTSYAADHGHTLLDLAMAWLAALPAVSSIIAGATKPEQVAANVAAAEWTLKAEQRDEITKLVSTT